MSLFATEQEVTKSIRVRGGRSYVTTMSDIGTQKPHVRAIDTLPTSASSDIRESSRDFFADIMHTVCQDILEDLVSKGLCDRQEAEDVVAEVAKKWLGEGIKIKKRPAPRHPVVKKEKQEYVHAHGDNYYYKGISLGRGLYPLYDHSSGGFWASYNPKTNEWFHLTELNKRSLRLSNLPIVEEA